MRYYTEEDDKLIVETIENGKFKTDKEAISTLATMLGRSISGLTYRYYMVIKKRNSKNTYGQINEDALPHIKNTGKDIVGIQTTNSGKWTITISCIEEI